MTFNEDGDDDANSEMTKLWRRVMSHAMELAPSIRACISVEIGPEQINTLTECPFI